jgi:glycosidase
VLEEYPNFNIVGEEMNSNPQILAYWQKGVQNRDGYQSFLPSLMDFPVVFLLPTVMNAPEARDSGFMKLYEMIANDFVYADPMRLVVFPDNHDTPRLFSLLRDDVSALKTALIFYATTRGIPQFYYGTEILAKSPVERDDGLVRSDMPGGWAGDKVNAFTGKGLSAEQADMQQLVRTLLNWRKTSDAVTQGKLLHFVPEAGVYVYFRYTDKQKVMVVLNKNAQDTKLELARFSEILGAASKGRNIVSGVSVNLTAPLALRAKESLVLEIQ